MIVIDTSALIAIAIAEEQAQACMGAMRAADAMIISAASVTEALIVAFRRDCLPAMQALLRYRQLVIEPVTAARAHAAGAAYRRYGKNHHPAALNFGDTFAYALAIERACPLLFVGNDFTQTDVLSALA